MNRKLAVILGIRPDVIRASVLLQLLHESPECDLHFIWTGQHYSDTLKDVFFRELQVHRPDIELNAGGETDAAVVCNVISKLAPVLQDLNPAAAVFLGDTNTVMGCIAATQFNIPVVHIEGCMRSYDWRMPEEKYRTVTDHLSDVIYAYFEEYRQQGIREGLNPASIVVVGNLIVDVLERYYFARKSFYDALADERFFASRRIERGNYWISPHKRPVRSTFWPATGPSVRCARCRFAVPGNVILVDPVGYDEILALIVNSRGVLTDSGTVVEETCVLGVPSVQMRKSTERPQVYDARSSVKFDPADAVQYLAREVFRKLESLRGGEWRHALGDGKSSERIAQDLLRRIKEDDFARHRPEQYHLPIGRSYRGDGIDYNANSSQ